MSDKTKVMSNEFKNQWTNSLNFVDLFAGVGGFHYSIKDLLPNSKLVMASEIDSYAKQAYSFNHGVNVSEIRNIKDYTFEGSKLVDVTKKEVLGKKVDIIFGGFPCQTFSNAGKKLGFMDEVKGTLFFDVAKLISITKPKYVLLENVKHLVGHDDGRTWETIKNTLKELGYIVNEKPLLLSPHQFGIPQKRERVFIPAIRNDLFTGTLDFSFSFSSNIKRLKFDKNVESKFIISDNKILSALEAWGEFIKNVKRPVGRTLPVIWLEHMNDKVVNTSGMQEWKKKYINDMKSIYKSNKKFIDAWMIKHNTKSWMKRESKLEWQAGKDVYDYKETFVQLRQSGFRFKTPDIFPTLVAMVQTSLFFDRSIQMWRYLTLNEVRQLQSFPNTFKYNVPDFQTYKQFGNSVNIDVVKFILKELLIKGGDYE